MSTISPIGATVAGLLSLPFLSTALPAFAKPDETPDAFVHRVYARYKTSDNSTGVDRTRPAGSMFYAAFLLDAFAKDDALLRGKEGVVDADPLCDCQAWENLRIESIALAEADPGTVKARVVIGNFSGAQRVMIAVVLTLLKTPAGWRIADVGDRHRASLRAAVRSEIDEMELAARPGAVPRKRKS